MHDKTITELAEEPLKKWIQLKKKYLTFFILMNDNWIFRKWKDICIIYTNELMKDDIDM